MSGPGPATAAHGRDARPPSGGATWLALAALLLAVSCPGGRLRPEVPEGAVPHLVLITVDTWRGDHALTERAGVALTPRLAELARTAVHYTDAQSASDCTSPGMTGILTGLYPRRSGVWRNLHVLQKGVPTLAGILRRAGFRTAAFITNPVLGSLFGFGRGFESYEFIPRRLPQAAARADTVVPRVLDWLDALPRDERFFLWVHLMEPHGPYEPPEDKLVRFPVDAFDAPRDLPLQPKGRWSGRGAVPHYQQIPGYVDLHDGREYLARYAAEVADLDASLGELLDGLAARGLDEQSVVVVTSDHGESLAGDHGNYFSHQNGLWQDQVHVPLLLTWPDCDPEVVDDPVSTIDIAPTVLSLLGVDLRRPFDGQDLLTSTPDRIVSESREELSVRRGGWKLTRTADGTVRLVDLANDPGELEDVSANAPDVLAALRAELQAIDAIEPLVTPRERETTRSQDDG